MKKTQSSFRVCEVARTAANRIPQVRTHTYRELFCCKLLPNRIMSLFEVTNPPHHPQRCRTGCREWSPKNKFRPAPRSAEENDPSKRQEPQTIGLIFFTGIPLSRTCAPIAAFPSTPARGVPTISARSLIRSPEIACSPTILQISRFASTPPTG